ncbi:Thioredoxin-like protein [Paramyrothecium foliicola]|nr:Thioredoxin-like protein [Paramyrothecium foliicola]
MVKLNSKHSRDTSTGRDESNDVVQQRLLQGREQSKGNRALFLALWWLQGHETAGRDDAGAPVQRCPSATAICELQRQHAHVDAHPRIDPSTHTSLINTPQTHAAARWRKVLLSLAPRGNLRISSRRLESLSLTMRRDYVRSRRSTLRPPRQQIVNTEITPVYADWCGPCQQIAPYYETIAKTLSRPQIVAFVKINSDNHKDISAQYSISALPTFLLFRDGKIFSKVQGADHRELKAAIEKLVSEVDSLGEGSGSGGIWSGAEIPRGYSDITDQIEIRGCELLNADSDAGPVKVLFENSKPSALDKGKGSSKDWVQSGADDQLLLFIPLQSSVKVHTLQLTSLPPQEDDAPARPGVIHLYINRPQNMDFGEADDTEPTQAITLSPEDWNENGTANISLRFVKFQRTTTLILYVQQGDGEAETVRLDRIKLIGEAGAKREMGKLQKLGDDE